MDGVLVIDKPKGLTSHDVVLKVRKVFGRGVKVGHTGTLDPIATGVLPICIGKATKLSSFLTSCKKEYIATMKLGEETDTLDSQGRVVYRGEISKEIELNIDKTLDSFKGEIEQVPPSYSAIKRNGTPLYELARRGICLKLEPRRVVIYDIALLNISLPFVTFRVISSSGTYVRSLCRDIGRALGCYGYMHDLRRIRSGEFSINKSLSLDLLHKISFDEIKESIIHIDSLLSDMTAIEVDRGVEKKMMNGAASRVDGCITKSGQEPSLGGKVRFLSEDGRLISIAEIKGFDKNGIRFNLLRVFV